MFFVGLVETNITCPVLKRLLSIKKVSFWAVTANLEFISSLALAQSFDVAALVNVVVLQCGLAEPMTFTGCGWVEFFFIWSKVFDLI